SFLKIPGWPQILRQYQQQRLFKNSSADAVLIWGEFGRSSLNLLDAIGPSRCIYWEHGTCWAGNTSTYKRRFLEHTDAVIANSHAAKRMLMLRWEYKGQIQVIPNALRPALRPSYLVSRTTPAGAWRLGLVARLTSLKGVAIALHSVAFLKKRC